MSKLRRRMLGLGDAPAAAPATSVGEPAAPPAAAAPSARDRPLNPRYVGLHDAGVGGFYQMTAGEVYRGVPITPDDVVVDVGCGEGAALGFCADRGAHIVAVDVHGETLDAARAFLEQKPAASKQYLVGSAESVPIGDEIASRVLCMEVLEHVDDPRAALAEMYRIGQPGALYLITVPDRRGEELTKLLGPDNYFEPPNHIRIIGRDELASWVTEAGLEIVTHAFNGFYWVIWYALFWGRGVDIDKPDDPVLQHWTAAWKALLDSDNGAEVKAKLDEFMPKSQIIVARKPGTGSDR